MDVLLKTNKLVKNMQVDGPGYSLEDITGIRVVDYTERDLLQLSEKYHIDLTIFSKTEDIEISSHYIQTPEQLSLNLTIPYYTNANLFVEEDIYILIKDATIFTFLTSGIESSLSYLLSFQYDFVPNDRVSFYALFISQISAISDYYADVVELISKKIKDLFVKTIQSKQFRETDLDYITELNFNNLLVRESVSEFQRILHLFRRGGIAAKEGYRTLTDEIYDLTVITDYLQSNFDRLDDLKENINSKIELEQNKIFKILTIITVCISLPMLIAGIYGMNFMHMPELNWTWGYPLVLAFMVLSFVLPLLFFKRKRWI